MGFVRNTVGALTGSSAADAAKQGAGLQYNATMEGIKLQNKALEQQRQDLMPFSTMAQRGIGRPDAIKEFRDMAVNQEDYSYNPASDSLLNNALSRTTRAVMDAQAAQGKLGSGSTLTSLTEAMAPIYMQRQGQMFDQRYNANNQQFNQLQNLVGMSQSAAAGQGAATASTANNVSNLMGQGANAQAAGLMGAANARAEGVNNMLKLGAMATGAVGGPGEALYMMGFSDRRAKTDIDRVGKMDDGTPIYTFKYKGDSKTHMGVMAQEARKKHPEAVKKDPLTNMLMVDYKRLGAK